MATLPDLGKYRYDTSGELSVGIASCCEFSFGASSGGCCDNERPAGEFDRELLGRNGDRRTGMKRSLGAVPIESSSAPLVSPGDVDGSDVPFGTVAVVVGASCGVGGGVRRVRETLRIGADQIG